MGGNAGGHEGRLEKDKGSKTLYEIHRRYLGQMNCGGRARRGQEGEKSGSSKMKARGTWGQKSLNSSGWASDHAPYFLGKGEKKGKKRK